MEVHGNKQVFDSGQLSSFLVHQGFQYLMLAKTYTFVELFSGEGWVSRVMKTAGHRGASLDILLGSQNHGQGKQDPFDLLTDAGFALL